MLFSNQPAVPTPVQLPKNFEKKRQRVNNYFAAFSCKAGRVMSFYSEPEFDHWALCEVNPSIVALCEEPLRISLPGDKKRPPKDYVIDLWLRYADSREEYVEVKPESELVDLDDGRRVPANWQQLELWMDKYNVACRFVTDADIYSNPLFLANAHRITRLAAQGYSLRNNEPFLNALVDKVSEATRLKLFELEQQFPDEDLARLRAAIGLLLVMGRLSTAIDVQIFDREAVLELSHG